MRRISSEYKKYTYDDLVADVIKAGIAPKRAYIFLAGIGIKGELARHEDSYGNLDSPQKVPVNEKGEVLLSPKAVFKDIDVSIFFDDKTQGIATLSD